MAIVAWINLASANQAKAGEVYPAEPKISVKTIYQIKKGDTLSEVAKRFYGSSSPAAYKALARWKSQVTHKKLWVFIGQKLEIPFPLVLLQERVNESPTTLSLKEAAFVSVWMLGKSLKEGGIKADIPDDLKEKIVSGINASEKSHHLNNSLAASVTFNEGVQGWTRIEVGTELSGKSSLIRLDNNYLVKATLASQCNNLYLEVSRSPKLAVFYPPPPKPPELISPPPFLRAERETAIAESKKETEYKWDWDSTFGGFDEYYTDGNHVSGWWQTSVLYPYDHFDVDGNEWSSGIAFATRNWSGRTGEPEPFHYKGDVDIWSFAERFRNQDWEIIGRLGLGERTDKGYLENQYGRFDSIQRTDLFNLYSSAEYNGRKDKRLFPKTRASVDIDLGFGEEKDDYWTDEWNGRQKLNNPYDSKDAYSFSLYSDILTLNDKKTVQVWGEFRSTCYEEQTRWGNGIKGGLNFFNGSFKIGPGYTAWNNNQADNWGWYWEANLYNLYHSIFGYKKVDQDFGPVDQKEKEKEILELLEGGLR